MIIGLVIGFEYRGSAFLAIHVFGGTGVGLDYPQGQVQLASFV